MTGSIPSCLSAIETATGEACACAEVLSVALTASTQGSYGSKRSRTASRPPELIVSSSAVTTNRPPAIASSSFDMPTRWRLPVALGQEVAPRGCSPEAVVHRRAQVVDLLRPRQLARALDRLQPHAAHFRNHLAATIGPDAAARAVAQGLRTVHRTGKARRVEDALSAHLAAEDRFLDGRLDERQGLHHAGTAERLRSIRSFAR